MKSSAEKWVLSVAVMLPLLLLCGFVGTKVDGGPAFLAAAGVYIVILCFLSEWLFRPRSKTRMFLTVLAGAGRGGVIGVCAWLAMMIVIGLLQDTGDKFALFVVFFIPFAFGIGFIGGCIARALHCRLRRIQV